MGSLAAPNFAGATGSYLCYTFLVVCILWPCLYAGKRDLSTCHYPQGAEMLLLSYCPKFILRTSMHMSVH